MRPYAHILFVLLTCFGCAVDAAIVSAEAGHVGNYKIKKGQRVAVLTFSGTHGSEMSNIISAELMKRDVEIVERDMLERVIAEVRRTDYGFYDEDLSDQEIVASLGHMIGADVLLYGEANAVDPSTTSNWENNRRNSILSPWPPRSAIFDRSQMIVSVRALSAETGEIAWWSTVSAYTQSERGRHVKMLDYFRLASEGIVDALMDPAFRSEARVFVNRPLPRDAIFVSSPY